MQEDVYQGDGLNLYAYCGNNPVMYYDPSGYMSKCPNAEFAPTNEEPLGLPGPGQTSASTRRTAAEQKLADAASGKSVGATIDPVTGMPVGEFYGDPNGHYTSQGQNHGHGHAMGTDSSRNGSGASLDLNGNIVDYRSPDAHWPTKK